MEPITLENEFTIDGRPAREISAGDFVRRRGTFLTEVGFDDRDAECLAHLLLRMAGGCDRILVALYLWVEEVWKELTSSHWTATKCRIQRPLDGRTRNWVPGPIRRKAKLLIHKPGNGMAMVVEGVALISRITTARPCTPTRTST